MYLCWSFAAEMAPVSDHGMYYVVYFITILLYSTLLLELIVAEQNWTTLLFNQEQLLIF